MKHEVIHTSSATHTRRLNPQRSASGSPRYGDCQRRALGPLGGLIWFVLPRRQLVTGF
jgi:hypothetical protein